MIEHVPGAAADQELHGPRPGHRVAGVVVADRLDERIPIPAQGRAVLAGLERELDADLAREIVDLPADDVADDLVALAAATPGTLAQLGRYARGHVVQVRP